MYSFDDTKINSLFVPRSANEKSFYAQDTATKNMDFPLPPSEKRDENYAGDLTAWEDTKCRIKEYANLQADWDGEDAEPISAGSITFALSLLQCAYEAAKENGFLWDAPDVAPDPNGQLDLLWVARAKEPDERRLMLLLSEKKQGQIVLVKQTPPAEPERFVVSQQQAVDAILWILSNTR